MATFSVDPLTPHVGAEIRGLNLARDYSDSGHKRPRSAVSVPVSLAKELGGVLRQSMPQHYAVAAFFPQKRVVERITISADRPI